MTTPNNRHTVSLYYEVNSILKVDPFVTYHIVTLQKATLMLEFDFQKSYGGFRFLTTSPGRPEPKMIQPKRFMYGIQDEARFLMCVSITSLTLLLLISILLYLLLRENFILLRALTQDDN